MNSGDTIKTTVRLPTELHWEFQSERAKRRLSNEKAVCEAFAAWITHPTGGPQYRGSSSRHRQTRPATPQERRYVETLLQILRDPGNPGRASALTAILGVLSGGPRSGNSRRVSAVMPRPRMMIGKKA